jgi:hypothetical protein
MCKLFELRTNQFARQFIRYSVYVTVSRVCLLSLQTLDYGLDNRGFDSRQGLGVFLFTSLPPRPDRLWGPPSLLFNGYQELFPWG